MNKSYLQWAGGKGKALAHLLPIINEFKFTTFIEPFVGAANVSLNVEAKEYIWNDLNKDLVSSHKVVLEDPLSYIVHCRELFENTSFAGYSDMRDIFNNGKIPEIRELVSETYYAAVFQYLNKHGFNGLCRYNSKGKYNVPIGTVTKNPKAVPKEQINYFSYKFNNNIVEIANEDFGIFMGRMNQFSNALIYCDPPYVPAGASNFKYTAGGFGIEEQERLVQAAKDSVHNVLISNHWNDVTKELYKDCDKVWTFPVQRTISRDGNNRVPVEECVVLYKGGK